MPWQRLVADVGCEIDPATGLPAYREVRVTVPRQSGKTTLFLSWQINRCVSRRWRHPQRSVFTAQTGKDARDKWLDELFPLIRNSRIRSLVASKGKRLEINEGMGNESIRFRTGSLIRLLSTASTSGHSKTLHQAVMDEVWHDTDDRREQGLRPAMITMPDAQLLVCSTAGTDASVILNRKIITGRAAVEADVGSGVAYFEYSAPDDWNPFDDDSFYDFHPALCPDPPCRCAPLGERWRHTITIDAIRAERDAMDLSEFCRAYGNRTPSSLNGWQVLAEAEWRNADRGPTVAGGRPRAVMGDRLALGVWVAPDRRRAAIGAAGGRVDVAGGRLVELTSDAVGYDVRPDTSWVMPRVRELVERARPLVVVTNDRVLADQEPDLLLLAQGPDQASASGMLYDGIRDGSVRHLGQPDLTVAVAGGVKRSVGRGWVWESAAGVDVSPVGAVSLALWGLVTERAHSKHRVPAAAVVGARARPAAVGPAEDATAARLREQLERDLVRSG